MFKKPLEQEFHVLADGFSPVALPFGHASGEECSADTRRVLQKLSNVTFCLDRILMEAQPILDRSCGLDKTSSGFTHRAASEFRRVAGAFHFDADVVKCGGRWGSSEVMNRLAQVLELSPSELAYGQGRLYDRGNLAAC